MVREINAGLTAGWVLCGALVVAVCQGVAATVIAVRPGESLVAAQERARTAALRDQVRAPVTD